ncbi:MAG: GNAT family N-acetyltransferase [Actinobacteria bacterium]|nr:GNAT family N-acetyltransferase [Actinomycetota bacterium]
MSPHVALPSSFVTSVPDPPTWSIGTWPFDATTAMITLHSAHRPDFSITDSLVDEWADATSAGSFQRVRTSAVGPTVADALFSRGFTVRQELDFLVRQLDAANDVAAPGGWRIGSVRRAEAVRIDVAAFGDEWALDESAFDNSCRATLRFRTRGSRRRGALPFTPPVGYCLTGVSEDSSYLQRLAVLPTTRRRGAAGALVHDALTWAWRLGARRMYVNTDVDNAAALSLYRQWGFESVGYRLRVLECDRTALSGRRSS